MLRSQKDFFRKENLQLPSSRCMRNSQRGRGSGEGSEKGQQWGTRSDQGGSELEQ